MRRRSLVYLGVTGLCLLSLLSTLALATARQSLLGAIGPWTWVRALNVGGCAERATASFGVSLLLWLPLSLGLTSKRAVGLPSATAIAALAALALCAAWEADAVYFRYLNREVWPVYGTLQLLFTAVGAAVFVVTSLSLRLDSR